jgi:predicted AlkP superfamily pyrophosphatase or phosphodiesterase
VLDGYDLRAISPTVAQILDVPVPRGAEVGPVAEVLDTLPSAERLVLVVIDGFGSALWLHVEHAVPTLNRLAGLHRLDISSVLPSLTYICLSTMLTGVSPENHGVVNLEDMVRVANAPQLDTVFDRVRDARRETFLAVHRRDVEGIPLDRYADQTVLAEDREDAEIYDRVPDLVRAHQPAFAFVHLIDIDETSHAYGPYTAEVTHAALEMDRRLKNFFAFLGEAGYALMVLADHGLHEAPGGSDNREGDLGTHDGSVEEDLVVPLLWASAAELQSL